MKLRIVTSGAKVKVQRKFGPFWLDCQEPFGPGETLPAIFQGKDEAANWIREQYGADAEIVGD